MEEKDKKDLLKYLKQLVPYWSKAKDIIYMIKNNLFGEKTYDLALMVLEEGIKKVDKKEVDDLMKKSKNKLQKIKQEEKIDKEKEEKEADDLLDQI